MPIVVKTQKLALTNYSILKFCVRLSPYLGGKNNLGWKTADVSFLAKPPISAHFPLPTSVTVASIVRVEVLVVEATSLPTSASLVTGRLDSNRLRGSWMDHSPGVAFLHLHC